MQSDRSRPAASVAGALIAAFLVACSASPGGRPDPQAAAAADQAPGTPADASSPAADAAPAVTVKFSDIAGIRAEMAKRRGRPIVINFWATWCVPCVQELPDLAAMSREFAKDGPDFIGVSLDAWVIASDAEAEKKVRDTLAGAKVAYANLIYRGDQDPIVDGFNLPGPIPYSVLYDRKGKQVSSWIGGLEKQDLAQALAKIP